MADQPSHRRPRPGTARARLGAELRRIRRVAGQSQRDIHGPTGSGHASNVERGHTQPSWDFIEKYLAHGGDPQHVRSLYELSRTESEHRKTEQRRGSQPGSFQAPPAPQEVGDLSAQDIRRHYVIETRKERYTFNSGGIATSVWCESAIRAISPGAVLFCVTHSYDADQRPGVLRIAAEKGCTLERVDTYPTGSLRAFLRLDRGLYPDDPQPYSCSYRVFVVTSVRARPILLSHPGPGTRRFTLDAQFAEPLLPRRLWWFAVDNELSAMIPGDGYDIPTNPDGHYRRSFEVLVQGWCYGLAWQW